MYSFLYRTKLLLCEYDKLKHSSIGRSFHSSGFFSPLFQSSITSQVQKEVGHNPGYENGVVVAGQTRANFQFGLCSDRARGPRAIAPAGQRTSDPGTEVANVSTLTDGHSPHVPSLACAALVFLQLVYTQRKHVGPAIKRVSETGWALLGRIW